MVDKHSISGFLTMVEGDPADLGKLPIPVRFAADGARRALYDCRSLMKY